MPTIQDANTKITNFPNKFVSPWGNDAITPLYSSMPLKSPVEGCLECIVCGSSNERYRIISSNNFDRSGGSVDGTRITTIPTAPRGKYYYTNAANNGQWGDLNNWNSKSDGTGNLPTEIPWSNTNNSTDDFDLIDTTGGQGVQISGDYSIDFQLSVTGSCDIDGILLFSTSISGGTFTGDNFSNFGVINGGGFSGVGFYNTGTINNGTFAQDGFANVATINDGTFTGDNFSHSGTINGGTFTGDNFGSGTGRIYDGMFTGDNFSNSYIIYGGIFTGGNFNNYGTIQGGAFSNVGFTNREFSSQIYGGTFSGSGFVNNGYVCAAGWPYPQQC
jgi:hypothetical protein